MFAVAKFTIFIHFATACFYGRASSERFTATDAVLDTEFCFAMDVQASAAR